MRYTMKHILKDRNGFVFERICPITGDYQAIYASELFRRCQLYISTQQVAVQMHKAEMMVRSHRIDMEKVVSLPEKVWIEQPGLLIETISGPDLIDGNHRYVRRALEGRQHMAVYFVPNGQWQPYLVEDFKRTI